MGDAIDDRDTSSSRRIEEALLATSRGIRRAYDKRLAFLELNLSEANLLVHVAEHGPVSQVWLAERLGMNRASTGVVIDTLHARDLITRNPHPTDRRIWLVTITPDGRRIAEKIGGVDTALRRELRAGVSAVKQEQLASTLAKLRANLRAITEDQ